jgi:hypothetical protein
LWQTSHPSTKNWRPKLSQVYVVSPVGLGLDSAARAVMDAVPRAFTSVDLAPALRAAEPGGSPYFVFDGHWTPRGHDVVAEALAPRVAERPGARGR